LRAGLKVEDPAQQGMVEDAERFSRREDVKCFSRQEGVMRSIKSPFLLLGDAKQCHFHAQRCLFQ